MTTLSPADCSGECELAMTRDAPGPTFEERLLVGRADPRVKITGALVREVKQHAPSRLHGPPYAELDGDLFRINGDNRRVVYRLVDYLPREDVYLAEWPD